MERNRGRRNRSTVFVAAVVLLAAGTATAAGRCLTVDVPASFVMPNGASHPPGSLKLCDSLSLSPVAALHKVYFDGHLTGILESRKGRSEGPAEAHPFVLFRRSGERLELAGYAWPDGHQMRTYVLKRGDSDRSRPRVAAAEGVPFEIERSETSGMILLAASAN